MRKNLAIGILAHVDAGKTTLSEGMLFKSGCLKRLGRVDHRNAFLDTDSMERKRGITIFSKQAVLPLDKITITLLDTPGHVDFSTEMERTLQVLDYAILVISGSDGVQGHTYTLWQLLARYNIPTFLFINKMDLPETDPARIMSELKEQLHSGCVCFSDKQDEQSRDEDIAMCDDEALSQFLEHGGISDDTVISLIKRRLVFPCYFGAALKLDGIDGFLSGLERYTRPPAYPGEFGAKVYKIARDTQNNRLTYMKITGGRLSVKTPLSNRSADVPEDRAWTEKVNQIRIYSGEKYQTADVVTAGMVCAVTGLNHTYPGQGLGSEPASPPPAIEPVLSYRILLPDGCDPHTALLKLRQLGEEDPLLAVSWVEQTREIHLQLMGEVHLEILRHVIRERFSLDVAFDAGNILYRETISEPVIGVGHFEPLRHYAEVHLLLEPGPRGSGLHFDSSCSMDILPNNWQQLVLTHLDEREHPGVLTGSPITDMKITLLIGKAHEKHTEGGDFRQATYRAVRQGLMQAKCILLEPWYAFRLEAPASFAGRAMTDLQRASDDVSVSESGGGQILLTGSAPVAFLQGYAAEITSYTRGTGRLTSSFAGFAPCRNQDEIVAAIGYDPNRDIDNPPDSIFCSHGSGVTVKWDRVKDYMHLDSGFRLRQNEQAHQAIQSSAKEKPARPDLPFELDKELLAIFEKTYGPVKHRDIPRQPILPKQASESTPAKAKPSYDSSEYLLVDGYNIIHAWDDLRDLAQQNMDAARQILMDALANYRSVRQREVILVFDAYKVPGGTGNVSRYHNIDIVYTKEAETADAYIEKVTFRIGKKHRVTVATSDGTIQLIIWGHGAIRISPQMLRAEIEQANADISAILEENNRSDFMPSIIFPE